MHIFGCPIYFHVTESKFDPRAKKAIFVGFNSGVKGYRLWCPALKKLVISRDVTFDEASMLSCSNTKNYGDTIQESDRNVQQVEFDRIASNTPMHVDTEPEVNESQEENEDHAPEPPVNESIAASRPKRNIKRPTRYSDYVAYALPIINAEIPESYKEAMNSSENTEWVKAMDEEMNSLLKNNTWELVQLPPSKRAIGCKWVYTKKEGHPREDNVRFKARVVAKGYAQKEGIDYNEVFSPVVKHSSIRIMLAFVAQFDLELVQLDVKTAFLHGDLDE